MYYYAVVDVNYIVTEIYVSDVEMDESNFIPIDSENYDLVGLWYDVNTSEFRHDGYKYLTRIVSVDGAGSGLDADMLDGKQASEFALASHNHTGYAASTHSHSGYATTSHNHDADYAHIDHTHAGFASSSHNHDSDYADINHSHSGYASSNHSHSGYASSSHTHSNYASSTHKHDSDYAALNHSHTGYASSSHTHSNYASSTHNHDSSYLASSGGTVDGDVNVTGSYKIDGQSVVTHDGTNVKFGSVNRATTINCLSTADMTLNGVGVWSPTLKPRGGNANQNLGTPSYRFNYCYLVNSPSVSSDKRLKENITEVDADEMLAFVDKLNVVDYNFKNEPNNERIGLIAQEVEEAGGEKFVDVGEDGMYGLKTADLVYPLIGAVQALYSKVLELESQIKKE